MSEKDTARKKECVDSRRDFLKLASLGTVLGGAAAVAGGSAQAAEAPDEAGSGYRESPHVKTYYDSVRF